MSVVFDTFFGETSGRLSNVSGAMITLAIMPNSKIFITANRGTDQMPDGFKVAHCGTLSKQAMANPEWWHPAYT